MNPLHSVPQTVSICCVPGIVLGARAARTKKQQLLLRYPQSRRGYRHRNILQYGKIKAVMEAHTELVAKGVVEGSHGKASKVVF